MVTTNRKIRKSLGKRGSAGDKRECQNHLPKKSFKVKTSQKYIYMKKAIIFETPDNHTEISTYKVQKE